MEFEFKPPQLKQGAHGSPKDGLCFMEAVSFVAGERHSDHPKCASKVIGAFMRQWNDGLDDEGRQKLLPYVERLVGTAASREVEDRRAWMATDWLIRTHTVAWLECAGLAVHAVALRALAEIRDQASLAAARPALSAAKKAGAAARAAARAAAWDAVWAAARAAARAAAWDAVWDAAWAAAWAAAWEKLAPVVRKLQASAFDLLDRMIAEGAPPKPVMLKRTIADLARKYGTPVTVE